jgi:hypothetical protein
MRTWRIINNETLDTRNCELGTVGPDNGTCLFSRTPKFLRNVARPETDVRRYTIILIFCMTRFAEPHGTGHIIMDKVYGIDSGKVCCFPYDIVMAVTR